MIELRPFRAWRPAPEKAHLVGTRSYLSYSQAEIAQRLKENPLSFLHVIRPDEAAAALPRPERFARVRAAFQGFCAMGTLLRDPEPAFYLYEQAARGVAIRGLICGVSIAAYREGRIKAHEQTLTAREELFAEYLHGTAIHAEPVLLATPAGTAWEALLDPLLATRPAQAFRTRDMVGHRLWPITDPDLQRRLQRAFEQVPALYIADGHHRLASSARLAEQQGLAASNPGAWCLACIVPGQELRILNFDRVAADLNGLAEHAFLEALGRIGELTPTAGAVAAPGIVGVRTRTGWHALRLPPSAAALPTAERLDAARLSRLVLAPLLGIRDLRSDPRIAFVPGTMGTAELERRVVGGSAAVAFHLHPVGFGELMAVADEHGTMPPKSTWIEPKLRSGMVVYPMQAD